MSFQAIGGLRRGGARCAGGRARPVRGKGGQEAGSRPTFLVGLFGELWPDQLGGGKTQLVEQHAEPGGINDIVLHAAPPVTSGPIRAS